MALVRKKWDFTPEHAEIVEPALFEHTETQHATQSRPIGQILVESSRLTIQQLERALELQKSRGGRLGDLLIARGDVSSDDVLWALAEQFQYPYARPAEGRLHSELVVANHPFSEDVEPFRDLRAELVCNVFEVAQSRRPALAIVSASVGDGKTFTAANLAAAFSQLPGRTLLVDCDMRSPRLPTVFGIQAKLGLSAILSGRAGPNLIQPVRELPDLYVLPVGALPPNPLELMQRQVFAKLIDRLRDRFDYVLLDTAASTHGADARIAATCAGAALVVSRRNHTSVHAARKLASQLERSMVRIAGVVMNEY